MANSSSENKHLPRTFRVRQAFWDCDHQVLQMIRRQVFVIEQHVPKQLEWDGRDKEALHLVAEDKCGRAIGTARLLPSGQIGRMAVLREWRGRGVGRRLLEEILRIALQENNSTPWLNAQASVIDFYLEKCFFPKGERFVEAGITHQRMVYRKMLR